MSDFIEIVDVSPRDGLQSQPVLLSVEHKLELVNRLIDAGIRRLEAVSFVNPKRVPQMADAEEVVRGLPQRDDVSYIGLALNLRGFERAMACSMDEVKCAVVASDTFSIRNQGATTEQTMELVAKITREVEAAGIGKGRDDQRRVRLSLRRRNADGESRKPGAASRRNGLSRNFPGGYHRRCRSFRRCRHDRSYKEA